MGDVPTDGGCPVVGVGRAGASLADDVVGLAHGYLADRFNRAKLVMLSLVLMTLSSIALAVLSFNHGTVGLMYIFLFLDAAAVILGHPGAGGDDAATCASDLVSQCSYVEYKHDAVHVSVRTGAGWARRGVECAFGVCLCGGEFAALFADD